MTATPATSGGEHPGGQRSAGERSRGRAVDGPAGRPGAVLAPQRLHPLTILLGAWRAVPFVFVLLIRPLLEGQGDWVTRVAPSTGLGRGTSGTVLVVVLALVASLVAAVLLSVVPWAVRRFSADGHELVVDSGLLSRHSRHLRLDRIQAVDIDEPLVARLLGMAVVRITMAAGDGASVRLAYLAQADAAMLRNRILAGAAGLEHDTPEAPERQLVSVPPGRAAGALLLTPATLWLLGFVVAALVFGLGFDARYLLPSLIPLLSLVLGLGATVLRQLNGTVGFTLAESPDGYRVRAGLFDRRSQTVPPGRVQGLRHRRPLLWRPLGWARVDVDVAGLAGRDGDANGQQVQRTDLLPVGTREQAAGIAGRVLGLDLGAVALTPVPRRARWLDPLAARVLAAGLADDVAVGREGLLSPTLTAVPYAKIQSVRVRQGPLQRRLRLATVHVDSPKGPVDLALPHRDLAEVPGLVADLLARARTARALAGPDRWMTRPPGSPAGDVPGAVAPVDGSPTA